MSVYTRYPRAYWSDRLGILVLSVPVGLALAGLGAYALATGDRRFPMAAAGLMLAMGLGFLAAGVFVARRPWPYRLSLDTDTLRLEFRPRKELVIPRAGIREVGIRRFRGVRFPVVVFERDGRLEEIGIGWGFADERGRRHPGVAIVAALKAELGLR